MKYHMYLLHTYPSLSAYSGLQLLPSYLTSWTAGLAHDGGSTIVAVATIRNSHITVPTLVSQAPNFITKPSAHCIKL